MAGTLNKRSFLDGPAFKLCEQQQQEVLRLHRDERVSTKELANVYNVSQGTIWRILRRFHAVGRPMASKQEQKIILGMSRRRKTRDEIATFLGRSRSFIFVWQKKLHCQRKHEPTEADKKIIIKLYREGKGQWRIARITGVPQAKVRRTLLEAGVATHKTGGHPFQMPPEQFSQFRADVLSRKYFAIDLAHKYGLTKAISLRLSKEILGVEKFYGGETYPPLSSPFPQRYDARLTGADYCRFLAGIFPNGVPEKEVWELVPPIISMLLEKFPFWRTADTGVLENLESHLVAAVATMRDAEGALVN